MPATGVPQSYYARFAAYLAERGFTVLTFDYRGIGRSKNGDIRKMAAACATGRCSTRRPPSASSPRTFWWSATASAARRWGCCPRLSASALRCSSARRAATGGNWPPLGKLWVWPVTHLGLDALTRLFGYFPGSRLGFGEDLPPGVATEWARWCRHPRYLVGALGAEDAYARLRAPLRAYAISDDAFAPLPTVEALGRLYPNSRWEIRKLAPRDVGVKALGHFGFFRERFRDSLWREAADWLERQ